MNIRWYWQERDDFSQLQTSVGEVSVERVKQPSELKSVNNLFMDLQRALYYIVVLVKPTT